MGNKPVERKFHVFRGEGRPVAERYAGMEAERIDQAVPGYFPGIRKGGDHPVAAVFFLFFCQTVEHIQDHRIFFRNALGICQSRFRVQKSQVCGRFGSGGGFIPARSGAGGQDQAEGRCHDPI